MEKKNETSDRPVKCPILLISGTLWKVNKTVRGIEGRHKGFICGGGTLTETGTAQLLEIGAYAVIFPAGDMPLETGRYKEILRKSSAIRGYN